MAGNFEGKSFQAPKKFTALLNGKLVNITEVKEIHGCICEDCGHRLMAKCLKENAKYQRYFGHFPGESCIGTDKAPQFFAPHSYHKRTLELTGDRLERYMAHLKELGHIFANLRKDRIEDTLTNEGAFMQSFKELYYDDKVFVYQHIRNSSCLPVYARKEMVNIINRDVLDYLHDRYPDYEFSVENDGIYINHKGNHFNVYSVRKNTIIFVQLCERLPEIAHLVGIKIKEIKEAYMGTTYAKAERIEEILSQKYPKEKEELGLVVERPFNMYSKIISIHSRADRRSVFLRNLYDLDKEVGLCIRQFQNAHQKKQDLTIIKEYLIDYLNKHFPDKVTCEWDISMVTSFSDEDKKLFVEPKYSGKNLFDLNISCEKRFHHKVYQCKDIFDIERTYETIRNLPDMPLYEKRINILTQAMIEYLEECIDNVTETVDRSVKEAEIKYYANCTCIPHYLLEATDLSENWVKVPFTGGIHEYIFFLDINNLMHDEDYAYIISGPEKVLYRELGAKKFEEYHGQIILRRFFPNKPYEIDPENPPSLDRLPKLITTDEFFRAAYMKNMESEPEEEEEMIL